MKQREPDELCPGEYCPLKMTCQRHMWWIQAVEYEEDPKYWEMLPAYKNGKCHMYEPKGYYGQ